jgi:hypothetical protein
MKPKIIYLFVLLTITAATGFTQTRTNWVYVGTTPVYEVYYLSNSVSRGAFTHVTVAGKFRKKTTDSNGNEYQYATALLTYYKSTYSDIRCIMSNKTYYYNDSKYVKSIEPKVEYIVSTVKILNDIYNKIK